MEEITKIKTEFDSLVASDIEERKEQGFVEMDGQKNKKNEATQTEGNAKGWERSGNSIFKMILEYETKFNGKQEAEQNQSTASPFVEDNDNERLRRLEQVWRQWIVDETKQCLENLIKENEAKP